MKIGFIGLGNMGGPMAINLVRAGHTVFVFDLSKDAMAKVVAEGASEAADIGDVAADLDCVITMLQKGDQVKAVTGSFFDKIKDNTLYIDSSTIDVASAREVHAIAREKNLIMVDAPVSGGVPGATAATLTFMVGGVASAFDAAKPVLECMGKNIIHAGGEGAGQVAKACNNMILAISMIGVSEGFNLAKRLGMDPKTFYDISSIPCADSSLPNPPFQAARK